MVGSAAGLMLVNALDAYFAEIAGGISAGTTESGVIDVHSIRKIKILGLPQINHRRNADPGGFEVRAGAGREVRRVGHGNRRVVSQVRLESAIGDVFIRGRTSNDQAPGDIRAIDDHVNGVDRITARRAGVETQPVARVDEDHVQREEAANDRRARTTELVKNRIVKKTGAAFVGRLEICKPAPDLCRTRRRDQLADRTGHRVCCEIGITDRNRLCRITGIGDLILKPCIRSYIDVEIIRLEKSQHIAARAEEGNFDPDVAIRPQHIAAGGVKPAAGLIS